MTHLPPAKASVTTSPSATKPKFSVSRSDAFNFNKEQYEELFATERQLGTTRARIVWTPATIAVGILALFLRSGNNVNISNRSYFISICIMYVVLALVFIADLYFHREQKVLRKMCKHCESLWMASAMTEHNKNDDFGYCIMDFTSLRQKADRETRNITFDMSNGLLFAYFVAISLIPVYLMPVGP